ncbi:XRE family transcriptional regulator [Streptomyces sp. URMC 129]|uniref:helix-turn-helix domain-containing protein n=1 Tax=Streptomyces sp. URMC 129 TaxID=3423407 RepID=UPI003F1AF2F1
MHKKVPEPHEIAAGLLGDERLLFACRERDMGALFRLLHHRGISTRRLAAAVDITQGRLYDYMNGRSRVEKLALFEKIADAFRIPGHLLGLARRDWEPTPATDRRVSDGPPPDQDDVAAIDTFRNADQQAGGGRLYGAVVRHLADHIAPRLVDPGSGRHVFAAAAAMTEMAGWMAHDSGQDLLAQRHFTRALPLAQAAGDVLLAANIAASMSHLALATGDAAGAAQWADMGLNLMAEGPPAAPLTARLHTMLARALASVGQHLPAVRALEQAHLSTERQTDAEHPWLSPFDAAALASESALVLRDLGRYEQALVHAEQAVALRADKRARSLVLSWINTASLHVMRGELDAAIHTGAGLLGSGNATGSVRVVRQLDELRALFRPHRGYAPVRNHLERLDDAARTRMLLLADVISPSPEGPSR